MLFSFSWLLKLQKAQNKCVRFCLNLPPRSHIDPSHFIKINWVPVSDRVEYCIVNTIFKYWNGIVPGYIHEVFKPWLCRYSTRSQMALDILLWKTNTVKKSLSFLGPKIWSKIGPNIKKMLEHCLLLCMLLRKIFYFICETNSMYYHILMIDSLIATLFLLVIIGILVNCLSYFKF